MLCTECDHVLVSAGPQLVCVYIHTARGTPCRTRIGSQEKRAVGHASPERDKCARIRAAVGRRRSSANARALQTTARARQRRTAQLTTRLRTALAQLCCCASRRRQRLRRREQRVGWERVRLPHGLGSVSSLREIYVQDSLTM